MAFGKMMKKAAGALAAKKSGAAKTVLAKGQSNVKASAAPKGMLGRAVAAKTAKAPVGSSRTGSSGIGGMLGRAAAAKAPAKPSGGVTRSGVFRGAIARKFGGK